MSDLVLLVCDISDPYYDRQIEVTEKILEELEYRGKILKVYNKCDKVDSYPSNGIVVSAKEKIGFDKLKEEIKTALYPKECEITVRIPYEKASLIENLRKRGKIISENFDEYEEILRISVDYSESLLYNDYIAN